MWTYNYTQNNELYHFGIPGMKWGHRKARPVSISRNTGNKRKKTPEEKKEYLKKAVKIGAIVAGTALAAYGTYKVSKFIARENRNRKWLKGMRKTHNQEELDNLFGPNRVKTLQRFTGNVINKVSTPKIQSPKILEPKISAPKISTPKVDTSNIDVSKYSGYDYGKAIADNQNLLNQLYDELLKK